MFHGVHSISVDGQMNCVCHVPVVNIAGVKISYKYSSLCSDPFGCTRRSVATCLVCSRPVFSGEGTLLHLFSMCLLCSVGM